MAQALLRARLQIAVLNKIACKVVLAGLIASLSGTVSALEGRWYLGIGGGLSELQPDTVDTAIVVDEKNGRVATVFIGWDFDNRSSGQFQLYSLGEAEYSDGQSNASYAAGDASLLYRFFDSRGRRPRGTISGTSFYGRVGLGFMHRDSDFLLDSDTPVYFGAGAGMETYLSYNLAMRLEALFHDTDAGSATLTLVSRFGGLRRTPAALPPVPPTGTPAVDAENPPEVEIIGTTIETQTEPEGLPRPQNDSDTDGVMDDQDQCPESAPGYPVTTQGCPTFGGILTDLTFNDRTADLASSIYPALDKLVQQLNEFPATYIELVAHTDSTGSEADQSELTRQRLRSIGVYLVRHGINQERLLLRSYGGLRPVFDNSTIEGRRRNNRIEVFENP